MGMGIIPNYSAVIASGVLARRLPIGSQLLCRTLIGRVGQITAQMSFKFNHLCSLWIQPINQSTCFKKNGTPMCNNKRI